MKNTSVMVVGNHHETMKAITDGGRHIDMNDTHSIMRIHNRDAKLESDDFNMSDPDIMKRETHFSTHGLCGRPCPLPIRQISQRIWNEEALASLDMSNREDEMQGTSEDPLGATSHASNVHKKMPKQAHRATIATTADYSRNDQPLNLPTRQASLWTSHSMGSLDGFDDDHQDNTHKDIHHLRDAMKRVSEFSVLEEEDVSSHLLHKNRSPNNSLIADYPNDDELALSARYAMADFEQPLNLPRRQVSEHFGSDSMEGSSGIINYSFAEASQSGCSLQSSGITLDH